MDIEQEEKSSDVMFSATSPNARKWMLENYESENLIFRLPEEQHLALEFRRAAEERSFTISVWVAPAR